MTSQLNTENVFLVKRSLDFFHRKHYTQYIRVLAKFQFRKNSNVLCGSEGIEKWTMPIKEWAGVKLGKH